MVDIHLNWLNRSHFLAVAPSCYLDVLDKLHKRLCRTGGPSLAASLEPLAHCRNIACLKVVPTTFLLVCFACLKESTCGTWKNAYFTSKALFILEIIKYQIFRNSNVMTSLNAQAWNTKHISLNKLGSKHSLVMKFGRFCNITK